MQDVGELTAEQRRVLANIREVITKIRNAVKDDPVDLDSAVEALGHVRSVSYELLNQLQHEALLLEVIADLSRSDFAGQNVRWRWNPHQTGTCDEPDLQGELNGEVIVSVEVTTSVRPMGKIDQRMGETLDKLAGMRGRRIYCVRSPEMRQRAQTKVLKSGYSVEVKLFCTRPPDEHGGAK